MDEAQQPPHRVLVVEDDVSIRSLVALHLRLEKLEVTEVADGKEALTRARSEPFDLIVLDVMLPGLDGITVCGAIRRDSMNADVPILMLTARREEADKVLGLETGADDYIGKPYEPRELLARIKSLLRRITGTPAASGPRVRMGRRVLDLEKRLLVDPGGGGEESLTASEYDLLKVFAENPNRPLTRDWLLEVTAHREMEAFDRAIDLRITRLRRKVEVDPAHPDAIRTVRGVGYMFVPPKD